VSPQQRDDDVGKALFVKPKIQKHVSKFSVVLEKVIFGPTVWACCAHIIVKVADWVAVYTFSATMDAVWIRIVSWI
jgi:hypothetical protein